MVTRKLVCFGWFGSKLDDVLIAHGLMAQTKVVQVESGTLLSKGMTDILKCPAEIIAVIFLDKVDFKRVEDEPSYIDPFRADFDVYVHMQDHSYGSALTTCSVLRSSILTILE